VGWLGLVKLGLVSNKVVVVLPSRARSSYGKSAYVELAYIWRIDYGESAYGKTTSYWKWELIIVYARESDVDR